MYLHTCVCPYSLEAFSNSLPSTSSFVMYSVACVLTVSVNVHGRMYSLSLRWKDGGDTGVC